MTTRAVSVLWLIKGLGPGGAERLLVNQARVADRAAFTIDVGYLVPWKDHLVAELDEAGVPAICFGMRREWDPRWVLRLRRRLRDRPVDVIHTHSPYVAALTRVMVRTLPRDRRPALVYTEHNRWPRHGRATRLINRATFGLDDHTIAVSEDVRATISPRWRSTVEVIVHGIDVEAVSSARRHRDEARAELGVGPDEVVIGIVANFRREKAYDDLIDAAAKVISRRSEVRFVSVGQGPLEDEMRRRVAELGIGDRFSILGYRADPVQVASGFDVFTLSSVHEGLPVSLMEALALGLPVVATDVGGIPQAVRDGVEAVLVPSRDPDALAAAFERVVASPEQRAEMGAASLTRSEAFDVTASQRRLEEIYRKAAADRSG